MRIPDGGKLYTENRIDGMRAMLTNTSVFDEIDGADIERIEVITGPASALYGSGAFGGTISVLTRQPPPDFKAETVAGGRQSGFKRTQGNVGTTFADGRVGFDLRKRSENDGGAKATRRARRMPPLNKSTVSPAHPAATHGLDQAELGLQRGQIRLPPGRTDTDERHGGRKS